MIFNTDGSMNAPQTLAFVKRRLKKLAVQPLESRVLDSTVKEILQLAVPPDKVSPACSYLEKNFLRRTNLSESKIPLSHIGERSLEWEFFHQRRDALPANPAAYISRHRAVGNRILHNLSAPIYSLNNHGNIYRIFMRYKSIYSARRKMRSKGLRSWEVGDYLAFAICPPGLRQIEELVGYFDTAYASDILYKQNGFADRLTYRRSLPGFPGRRIFYIIRFDEVVCFEVQIVTLRQLIFLHLDHPRYMGKSHSPNELRSLEIFGDRTYLLDLLELMGETEKEAFLESLRQ